MRGIEGALLALQGAREGKFVGEALRALKNDVKGRTGEGITVPELSLASSLAYAALRRQALWEKIVGSYIGK
ncbi:MAG: hypothetical protein LBS00_13225, partial [Synergistaceae bacterium]|nr:hypothetical protein [Synergistaceae bacterium]